MNISLSNQLLFYLASCPICNKKIQMDRINTHLDVCLKEQESNDRYLPTLCSSIIAM